VIVVSYHSEGKGPREGKTATLVHSSETVHAPTRFPSQSDEGLLVSRPEAKAHPNCLTPRESKALCEQRLLPSMERRNGLPSCRRERGGLSRDP